MSDTHDYYFPQSFTLPSIMRKQHQQLQLQLQQQQSLNSSHQSPSPSLQLSSHQHQQQQSPLSQYHRQQLLHQSKRLGILSATQADESNSPKARQQQQQQEKSSQDFNMSSNSNDRSATCCSSPRGKSNSHNSNNMNSNIKPLKNNNNNNTTGCGNSTNKLRKLSTPSMYSKFIKNKVSNNNAAAAADASTNVIIHSNSSHISSLNPPKKSSAPSLFMEITTTNIGNTNQGNQQTSTTTNAAANSTNGVIVSFTSASTVAVITHTTSTVGAAAGPHTQRVLSTDNRRRLSNQHDQSIQQPQTTTCGLKSRVNTHSNATTNTNSTTSKLTTAITSSTTTTTTSATARKEKQHQIHFNFTQQPTALNQQSQQQQHLILAATANPAYRLATIQSCTTNDDLSSNEYLQHITPLLQTQQMYPIPMQFDTNSCNNNINNESMQQLHTKGAKIQLNNYSQTTPQNNQLKEIPSQSYALKQQQQQQTQTTAAIQFPNQTTNNIKRNPNNSNISPSSGVSIARKIIIPLDLNKRRAKSTERNSSILRTRQIALNQSQTSTNDRQPTEPLVDDLYSVAAPPSTLMNTTTIHSNNLKHHFNNRTLANTTSQKGVVITVPATARNRKESVSGNGVILKKNRKESISLSRLPRKSITQIYLEKAQPTTPLVRHDFVEEKQQQQNNSTSHTKQQQSKNLTCNTEPSVNKSPMRKNSMSEDGMLFREINSDLPLSVKDNGTAVVLGAVPIPTTARSINSNARMVDSLESEKVISVPSGEQIPLQPLLNRSHQAILGSQTSKGEEKEQSKSQANLEQKGITCHNVESDYLQDGNTAIATEQQQQECTSKNSVYTSSRLRLNRLNLRLCNMNNNNNMSQMSDQQSQMLLDLLAKRGDNNLENESERKKYEQESYSDPFKVQDTTTYHNFTRNDSDRNYKQQLNFYSQRSSECTSPSQQEITLNSMLQNHNLSPLRFQNRIDSKIRNIQLQSFINMNHCIESGNAEQRQYSEMRFSESERSRSSESVHNLDSRDSASFNNLILNNEKEERKQKELLKFESLKRMKQTINPIAEWETNHLVFDKIKMKRYSQMQFEKQQQLTPELVVYQGEELHKQGLFIDFSIDDNIGLSVPVAGNDEISCNPTPLHNSQGISRLSNPIEEPSDMDCQSLHNSRQDLSKYAFDMFNHAFNQTEQVTQ